MLSETSVTHQKIKLHLAFVVVQLTIKEFITLRQEVVTQTQAKDCWINVKGISVTERRCAAIYLTSMYENAFCVCCDQNRDKETKGFTKKKKQQMPILDVPAAEQIDWLQQ